MPHEDVTVVVPTYNERESLPHLAAAVLLQGFSLLVVDDNSPDGTGEIADSLAREAPRLGVIHRVAKEGLGPAYAVGFDRALEEGARIVVEMDADFSHNPTDLPRLVEAVDAAPTWRSARYVPEATPDWRSTAGSSRGRELVRPHDAGDTDPDATAVPRLRAEALKKHRIVRRGIGIRVPVEMAWRAHQAGFDIREIPIVFRDREQGKSKMGTGIVVEAMWLVTKWGLARRFGSVP